jgi:glycogen synthase
MSQFKILHLIHQTSPVATGYTVRTNAILTHLRHLDVESVAVTRPGFVSELPLEMRESFQRERVVAGTPHVHHLRSPVMTAALTALTRVGGIRGSWRLRTALEAWEARRFYHSVAAPGFDLYHAHSPYDNAFHASHLSRQFARPFLYEVRGAWEDSDAACGIDDQKEYDRRQQAETQAALLADRLVTISMGLRRDFIARGVPESKIHVVPNGVDASRFPPQSRDRELAAKLGLTGKTVVGYVSLLRRLEGVDTLIEAVGHLVEQRDDMACLIVGDGPDADRLRCLAMQSSRPRAFVFTGRVPHSEVLRYYSLLDVFVVPRIKARVNEMVTPLKPLEAMAAAKALVVSDVGGLTELVQDGSTGLTFPPGDALALAHRIITLAGNPDLRHRLSSAAREWVLTERDWRVITRTYLDIYSAALDNTASSSHKAVSTV